MWHPLGQAEEWRPSGQPVGQPRLSWAEGGGCPRRGSDAPAGAGERDKGQTPTLEGYKLPRQVRQQIFQDRKQGSRWEPAAIT